MKPARYLKAIIALILTITPGSTDSPKKTMMICWKNWKIPDRT